MTTEEMRGYIHTIYPGWKIRDDQVYPVYKKMLIQGKFDQRNEPKKHYHQISLFEYYGFNLIGKEVNETNAK